MNTEDVWKGEFGDEYHKRNQVDWVKRIPFWATVLENIHPRSVCEYGCGPGWNLSAIKKVDPLIKVSGWDINHEAIIQANNAGVFVDDEEPNWPDAELVFSAGFLIHIPPDQIDHMIQSMINASYRYVMAIEYYSEHEEEITYRGQDDLLWKRPYGSILDAFDLKHVATTGNPAGFDDCTCWIFEKKS